MLHFEYFIEFWKTCLRDCFLYIYVYFLRYSMDRINFYLSSTYVIRFIEIQVSIKVRSLIIKVANSGFYAGKS